MILDTVTSLADLIFKSKTNKYYRQLAVISGKYVNGDNCYSHGRQISNYEFETALKELIYHIKVCEDDTCCGVCATINDLRYHVREEPKPAPKPKPKSTN